MADDHTLQLTEEYKNWFADLKNRIRLARLAYARLAIENGWSRNVMVHHIE